jgi:hypothetical protein
LLPCKEVWETLAGLAAGEAGPSPDSLCVHPYRFSPVQSARGSFCWNSPSVSHSIRSCAVTSPRSLLLLTTHISSCSRRTSAQCAPAPIAHQHRLLQACTCARLRASRGGCWLKEEAEVTGIHVGYQGDRGKGWESLLGRTQEQGLVVWSSLSGRRRCFARRRRRVCCRCRASEDDVRHQWVQCGAMDLQDAKIQKLPVRR